MVNIFRNERHEFVLCFSIEEPLGLFDELYDKPWTRMGPYVVGMCVGWVLCRTNCTIKMPKVRQRVPACADVYVISKPPYTVSSYIK
jgi:hypothetical protein